jgi:hypothetical protein
VSQSTQVTPDTTEQKLEAPSHVKDGPNGSVQVDPALVPAPTPKVEGERPKWLPEKFKTVEDFVKSHSELEKKLGATPPKKDEPAPQTQTEVTVEAAKKAGIDVDALSAEYAKNGELSAESLESLNKAGFNKAAVDGYIAGQKAIADQQTATLEAVAGGKDQLKATLEWAKANLTEAERNGYDAALDSGNIELVKLAMQGVVSKYTAANGSDPALVGGGEETRSGDAAPFASQAEIIRAMQDPRYKTDTAYQAKVYARLANTEGNFISTRSGSVLPS